MKSFRIPFAVALIGSVGFSTGAFAATIDSNAPVVKLYSTANGGCVEAGATLNNCFTDINTLNSWIWGTRKPTSTTPLVVEIGPGTFGQYFCGGGTGIAGRVSYRGAGMDKTTLASITLSSDCANVAFSDMTVGGTGVNYGVVVLNPGSKTTWTNVKLAGSWQEYCTLGKTGGRHNWFGSQVVLTQNGAGGYYQVACDESWFYGSEITSQGSLASGDVFPFLVSGRELHVYGSIIRALGTGSSASYALGAVEVTGGKVHIHGTGIDVLALGGAPANIFALWAVDGAEIHADVSSYNLNTGTGGIVTRILKDTNPATHVHAPYQWQHIPSYPLVSVNGADITTVTTGTSDGQPHMAIYSDGCTSKWYDTTDKVCRP
jgi:hypothetical protein